MICLIKVNIYSNRKEVILIQMTSFLFIVKSQFVRDNNQWREIKNTN